MLSVWFLNHNKSPKELLSSKIMQYMMSTEGKKNLLTMYESMKQKSIIPSAYLIGAKVTQTLLSVICKNMWLFVLQLSQKIKMV